MITRLTNCRIIDETGERAGEIVIENGVIVENAGQRADVSLDMAGLAVMPAFVDTHCHLRDPGFPEKETMETGMRAALAGGYATLSAMANTRPVCSSAELVGLNLKKAEALNLCRLVQAGAAGEELGDIIPTDRAALSRVTNVLSNDGKTIFSDSFMEELLRDSERYGFIVSTHSEPEAETVARDIALVEKAGGRLHVGHISLERTASLIREAKKRGLPVTCEVMPHHIFAHSLDYRVNPPFRTEGDVRALIDAVFDGTVYCLATDHAPHTGADKLAGAAGISNTEHAAAIFHTVLSVENGLPLPALSRLMSANPTRLLGIGARRIAPGEPADITAFDTECEWTIRRDEMLSRSHNTPFEGRRVRGKVKMTMVRGELLYDNRQAL